ncbi:MAG: hypothetical protein QM773_09415 [Hyphomonadaceae bacterium]
MRKTVLAAAAMLATGLSAPAFAQPGAQQAGQPPVQDKHWSYIVLADGVIGWQDGAITRDTPANTARVATFFYYNTPNELPSFAQLEVVSSSSEAGGTYDFESRIVTYACGGNTLVNEKGLFFSIVGDRPKSVATSEQQPYEHVSADIDATIRKSVCEGVNPADAATAKGIGDLISIAVTLEKSAAAAAQKQ